MGFNHLYFSFFHYTKTFSHILPPDEPEPLCALVMGTLAILSIVARGAALPIIYKKEKFSPQFTNSWIKSAQTGVSDIQFIYAH